MVCFFDHYHFANIIAHSWAKLYVCNFQRQLSMFLCLSLKTNLLAFHLMLMLKEKINGVYLGGVFQKLADKLCLFLGVILSSGHIRSALLYHNKCSWPVFKFLSHISRLWPIPSEEQRQSPHWASESLAAQSFLRLFKKLSHDELCCKYYQKLLHWACEEQRRIENRPVQMHQFI